MDQHTELQLRILDEVNRYAPTLAEVQANERETAAWVACALKNPGGVEAYGLVDILALHRTFRQLYWKKTLAQSSTSATWVLWGW